LSTFSSPCFDYSSFNRLFLSLFCTPSETGLSHSESVLVFGFVLVSLGQASFFSVRMWILARYSWSAGHISRPCPLVSNFFYIDEVLLNRISSFILVFHVVGVSLKFLLPPLPSQPLKPRGVPSCRALFFHQAGECDSFFSLPLSLCSPPLFSFLLSRSWLFFFLLTVLPTSVLQ